MKKIRTVLTLMICILPGTTCLSQDKNVITNLYSRGDVNKYMVTDHNWINYPAYSDRSAWLTLPDEIRKKTIAQGEKYLGYDWPAIKATEYLEFTRTGNRAVVDEKVRQFSGPFRALLMAELMEGKGRFLDDIINGVFTICERTYWGQSAHFYLYGHEGSIDKPATVLPDLTNPVIDLGVGDIAADLAWSWYFLHEEFDKVSPVIAKRLKDEIKKKVLDPFYTRNDFWWLYGWGADGNVNNWNPWVNYNVLTCILLLEDDPLKRNDAIYKSLASVDIFLNHYPQDGSCSEGPGYWGSAVGRFYSYLDLIHKVSSGKINIFKNEKVKEMGRYIYRVYISKGVYYTNYADASLKINRSPASVYKIGSRIGDPVMQAFAAFLYNLSGDGERGLDGRVGDNLENLFNPVDWSKTKPAEPLISEYYFPDWDAAIARDKPGTTDGFYFSVKGGSNAEQHNHNDVGSFMLYFNGDPVFLDLGVGTYTRETFGKGRYDIWTMQSNYHNLPVINGVGQKNGRMHRAFNSKFTSAAGRVNYTTDISRAYTSEAKVKSWVRSYTLERGKKFTINDRYQLLENNGSNSIHFITNLPCRIVKPGIIELAGTGFAVQLKYDPSVVKAGIEVTDVTDPKLMHGVGNRVARLVFKIQDKKLAGNVNFEVLRVK